MYELSTTITRYSEETGRERNIDLLVEFDYQPAEPQELNYPGCEEKIELTHIKTHEGIYFDLLNSKEVDDLELECIESITEKEEDYDGC